MRLLTLIDQLPSASRFADAAANDEEVMRDQYRHMDRTAITKTWTPRVSEMDAQLRATGMLYDRLGEVVQAVIASIPVEKGKTKPRIETKPFPRPESIFERIKEEESRQTGAWLVDQFMPHAAGSWSMN